MKTKIINSTLLLAFIAISSIGFAQTRTPRINHRQENQQRRIANGVKDGELTARETARLETREAKVQHDKRLAKSDGVVTGRERRNLRREEDRTSRTIYHQKHDLQTRP
jgi:hypothetical protein